MLQLWLGIGLMSVLGLVVDIHCSVISVTINRLIVANRLMH